MTTPRGTTLGFTISHVIDPYVVAGARGAALHIYIYIYGNPHAGRYQETRLLPAYIWSFLESGRQHVLLHIYLDFVQADLALVFWISGSLLEVIEAPHAHNGATAHRIVKRYSGPSLSS